MSNDATALINTEGTAAYPMDASLAAQVENCPNCKNQIPSGEQFCPRCGYQRGTWESGPQLAGGSAAGAALGDEAVSAEMRSGADPKTSPYFLENSHGQQFGLAMGETVIGRGEVDIQLNDNFASRRHARFIVSEDEVMVQDLGSSNGTFIEEAQLTSGGMPLPLSHGEKVKVGGTLLTLHRNSEYAGAAPAELQIGVPVSVVDEAHIEPVNSAAADSDPINAVAIDAASDAAAEIVAAEVESHVEHSPWGLQFAEGEPVLLKLGSTTFGRKADKADLVVSDGYVSSLHGQFDADADELSITDLGSTNGTVLNEEKLTAHMPRALSAGDIITLGQTQIVVSREE